MHEEERRSSSFFNGLTLGAVLGAGFFFLFGTKKGRKVKARLVKKGKNFWKELEEIIEEIKKDPDFLAKKTKKLTDKIDEKTQQAKVQVGQKVEETKEVVVKAKRFFQKNGRSLGK